MRSKLANRRESQLPADHLSITAVPGVITDGPPNSIDANLHPSLCYICSTSQTKLTISTVCWNWLRVQKLQVRIYEYKIGLSCVP